MAYKTTHTVSMHYNMRPHFFLVRSKIFVNFCDGGKPRWMILFIINVCRIIIFWFLYFFTQKDNNQLFVWYEVMQDIVVQISYLSTFISNSWFCCTWKILSNPSQFLSVKDFKNCNCHDHIVIQKKIFNDKTNQGLNIYSEFIPYITTWTWNSQQFLSYYWCTKYFFASSENRKLLFL